MADIQRPREKGSGDVKRNRRRALIAALLMATLGCLFVSLGNWQLNRADERRAIAKSIEQGRQAAPILISANTRIDSLQPWQSADAQGKWVPQWSLLLDNRNLDGKPGYWLATPLQLDAKHALLVLRGWIARPIGSYNPFPSIEQSTGTVSIRGEIAMRVPQLYEIADRTALKFSDLAISASGNATSNLDINNLPQVQNVSVEQMSIATGLSFMPIVLLQTNATDNDNLVHQWPTPSVDADTNMGYALQWFSFAAIAFGAMCVLLWRNRRRATILP